MYTQTLLFSLLCVLVAQGRNYRTQVQDTTRSTKNDCCIPTRQMMDYMNSLSNTANRIMNEAESLKRSITTMASMMQQCNQPVTRAPAPRRSRYDWRYRDLAERSTEQPAPLRYQTVKSSCKEWFEYNRYQNNGEMFRVDPFNSGKQTTVRCVFHDNKIITEIAPKRVRNIEYIYEGNQGCYDKTSSIPGEDDYCEERAIQYPLSREDIYRVMAVSGKCSQRLIWGCHGHKLLYVVTQRDWTVYGVTLSSDDPIYKQGRCDCSVNGNCTQSNLTCECSADKDKWESDYITVDGGVNNENLPIRLIAVGDLDGPRERAQIIVEKVSCVLPMNGEEIVEQLNAEEETTTAEQPETTPAEQAESIPAEQPDSTPAAPASAGDN